jgi:hypothetical protein
LRTVQTIPGSRYRLASADAQDAPSVRRVEESYRRELEPATTIEVGESRQKCRPRDSRRRGLAGRRHRIAIGYRREGSRRVKRGLPWPSVNGSRSAAKG